MTKQVFNGAIHGQVAGGDIINEAPSVVSHWGPNYGGVQQVINGPAVFNLPSGAAKPKIKVVVPTGPEHISEDQAAVLSQLVREVVALEQQQKKSPKGFQAVWLAVNRHCKVTRYRLIAADSFVKAEKYLRQWIGRLNSMPSAPLLDNDAWRKRQYAFIKTNTKAEDDAAWFAGYLQRTFGVASITELEDQALKRAYGAVASRKRDKGRKAQLPAGA